MRTPRALIAADPRRFGRGRLLELAVPRERGWSPSEDMQLFAAAFAVGFVFVSILIG